MNFAFGNQFPGSIPVIPQFTTGTSQLVSSAAATAAAAIASSNSAVQQQQQQQQLNTTVQNNRYQQQQQQQQTNAANINMAQFQQANLPLPTAAAVSNIPAAKFCTSNNNAAADKYNGHLISMQTASATNETATVQKQQQQQQQQQLSQYTGLTAYTQQCEDKRLIQAANAYPQNNVGVATSTAVAAVSVLSVQQNPIQPSSPPHQLQTQLAPQELTQDLCNALLQQQGVDSKRVLQNTSWQSLTPGATVADYLCHLPANTLPLSLHHFLKYSAENIKKENSNLVQTAGSQLGISTIGTTTTITIPQQQLQQHIQNTQLNDQQALTPAPNMARLPTTAISTAAVVTSALVGVVSANITAKNADDVAINTGSIVTAADSCLGKPKKRKRRTKQHKTKPKPGEIRLTTALDGSCLYMCPECQVAYPELELLEIHLIGHNSERRFICDVCQAVLKRKDHLTRHKQSHNPERPFICTVCLKAFKRKEQLSLHFVIHSGEKKHICHDCGKRFYRKDHLRKHTRSHIARRLKAELCLQKEGNAAEANRANANAIDGVRASECAVDAGDGSGDGAGGNNCSSAPAPVDAANESVNERNLLNTEASVIATVHTKMQQQTGVQQLQSSSEHQIQHNQQLPQYQHQNHINQQQPQHTQLIN